MLVLSVGIYTNPSVLPTLVGGGYSRPPLHRDRPVLSGSRPPLIYHYICYAQSTDSDHPRILLCKPRIQALHNTPRIAHANIGSADFAGQTSDPHAIFTATNPRSIAHANVRDRLWLRRCGWPSCSACAIDHGFIAADGRGLVVRS